ncbi:MAG: sigma 54-interacting transcriptional regulator [Bacteriovoracales bacterium]|nr:sigma 54-interacting transcriptional regulator [Bacteriovoracales bacterium]
MKSFLEDLFTQRLRERSYMDLQKLALAKCPILIIGPTGVGKSYLAEKIHGIHRLKNPFIEVDVAAIHEATFDGQLFGHKRGSFTGAVGDQIGLCKAVRDGTLFLDEIGDLGLDLQKKLLMLIERRSFLPIGSDRRVPFEGHLILATNRKLGDLVKSGNFREDLYYRIRVIEIEVKPLCERKDEVAKLIPHLIFELAKRYPGKDLILSKDLENFLIDHPWPGNIRELKNTLEYLFVFSEKVARIGDLPASILEEASKKAQGTKKSIEDEDLGSRFLEQNSGQWISPFMKKMSTKSFQEASEDFEKSYFSRILEENNGRINQTSREIGISKTTLIMKARKYKIDTNRLRAKAVMECTGSRH